MNRLSVKLISSAAALILGSGLTSVYALTETDFTNTGIVISSQTQFENNDVNNNSSVLVLPKGLTVEKVADSSAMSVPTQAGDIISYSITLDNIGLLGLTGVVIDDAIIPNANLTLSSGDTNSNSILDGDEIWLYTGDYIVTQDDIDTFGGGDGDIDNTVTVSTNELDPLSDEFAVAVTQSPEFKISKSVDQNSISDPSTLNYVVAIENIGNMTLSGVIPVDTLPDGTVASLVGPITDTGTVGKLDVGEIWEFTTSYVATQADIDAGVPLINRVSATAIESGSTVVNTTVSTNINSQPQLRVEKQVDLASLSSPGALSYSIDVENIGNVTLTNVSLEDVLPDGTTAVLVGPLSDNGLIGQLDVGEIWTYTTSYSVSQGEIDAGLTRTNTVSVVSNETGVDPISDTAQTTLTRLPSFSVTKTVDSATITNPTLLAYEIVVTNTGNTSLTDIQINDTLPDGSVGLLTGPEIDSGVNGVLDVGESWEFVGEYQSNQDEIDAGTDLTNTVSVATAEAGNQNATAVTSVVQKAEIEVAKSSDAVDFTAVGDSISYTIVVTNTGNVKLSNIVVSDPLADVNSLICPLDSSTILLPAEKITCTATRTVSESEVVGTQISNQASVSSQDPAGDVVSANSNLVVVAMLRLAPVAIDDTYVSSVSAVAVILEGAANDVDVNGDLVESSVNLISADAIDSNGDGFNDTLLVVDQGTWLVDSVTGQVSFTPVQGFTADPSPIGYTVSDATQLVSNEAMLVVDYPQSAPVAEDDYKQNVQTASPGNPTSVNVLADNGNGPDSDPENDIAIQSVEFIHADASDTDSDGDADSLFIAGEGTWTIDNLTAIVTFTPVSGFLFDPTPVRYTVSDINGLVSNAALITVDYPQTAPIANDDESLNQALGQLVALSVVDNDSDAENNIDVSTVALIEPSTQERIQVLTVSDEGIWNVDASTGVVTFTPNDGFITDPTPVSYTVFDTTNLESNLATITITYEEPASLEGIVWLDGNRNGIVDDSEERKVGWTLKVFNDSGVEVASAITDDEGYYLIQGLIPGAFLVEFYNEAGVFMDSQKTDGVVESGQVVNLPLAVDPGGVVYDSISRESVAGVTLTMINGLGDLLHPDCLLANQQSQVTLEDGLYAFNLNPGAHSSCPEEGAYRIEIAGTPEAYHPNFSTIIRQEGAAQCGDATLGCAVSSIFESSNTESNCTVDSLPGTNACEVQIQPTAPDNQQDTLYFVEFFYQAGDRNVIFNHLPIDAVANDAQILLSKTSNKRAVSIGSLVEYTLTIENTKDVPAVALSVIDTPPANFLLVPNSVRMLIAGIDGEFNTDDDTVKPMLPSQMKPMVLDDIDLEPSETIRIKYIMRVGVGVVAGSHVNTATAEGPAGVASNLVSASVEVVLDPVLEQATLIGKVFNDRDSDGNQDTADATGLSVRSHHYGWESLSLPAMPGRNSVSEDPSEHSATINMPVSEDNQFMVVTDEGTRISVDHDGNVTEAHVGDKARGLNAQDIRVCTQLTRDIPTDKKGVTLDAGVETDVLQIVIQNYGVNEQGIPGVRLATVTGLLIETDAYGRYSIPDVDASSTGIGQNFVLKVDPATLPQGAEFTTENPYVLRILNSSLNKINFGVNIPEDDPYIHAQSQLCADLTGSQEFRMVEVSLGSVFFDVGQHNVREDQFGIVMDIIQKLREYGGGKILIEAHADSMGNAMDNISLAERRAISLRTLLSEELGSEIMDKVNVEVNPAAYREQLK